MAESVEARFRRFLLGTAAVVYLAAAVELWLMGHYEGWQQWVPFGLIGIGVATALWVRAAASRRSIGSLRTASALVVAGSVLGVFFHVQGNLEFEREIRPAEPLTRALWEAAQGASPLLAPGTLALAAALAAVATYRHPRLPAARPVDR